jgi:hypothetical protein
MVSGNSSALLTEAIEIRTKRMSGEVLLPHYPDIEVRDDSIVLSVRFPDDSADPIRLKSEIDGYIHALEDTIQNLQRDVDHHNTSAPQEVQLALQRRRSTACACSAALFFLDHKPHWHFALTFDGDETSRFANKICLDQGVGSFCHLNKSTNPMRFHSAGCIHRIAP